jgi:hypothetical protein
MVDRAIEAVAPNHKRYIIFPFEVAFLIVASSFITLTPKCHKACSV